MLPCPMPGGGAGAPPHPNLGPPAALKPAMWGVSVDKLYPISSPWGMGHPPSLLVGGGQPPPQAPRGTPRAPPAPPPKGGAPPHPKTGHPAGTAVPDHGGVGQSRPFWRKSPFLEKVALPLKAGRGDPQWQGDFLPKGRLSPKRATFLLPP